MWGGNACCPRFNKRKTGPAFLRVFEKVKKGGVLGKKGERGKDELAGKKNNGN